MRVGDDCDKSVSLQCLLKEYENVTFRNGESVNDFTMHINGLIASLRELGEEMEDSRVVRKILHVIPKKLRQVRVAIEMLADLDTMTVEQLVGRLCAVDVADAEDVVDGVAADCIEQLLLTEEQWEARRCWCAGKEKVRGTKGGGCSGGHGKDDDNASTCSGGSRGAAGRH
jgi:hypothetical protein